MDNATLIQKVLQEINAVRREIGNFPLASLPRSSLRDPEMTCPVAKALSALILLDDRRIVFSHAWYAAAATKVWRMPFRDVVLLSVSMPDAVYDFATAFRAGAFPELLE
jgi:hypothetical protein